MTKLDIFVWHGLQIFAAASLFLRSALWAFYGKDFW